MPTRQWLQIAGAGGSDSRLHALSKVICTALGRRNAASELTGVLDAKIYCSERRIPRQSLQPVEPAVKTRCDGASQAPRRKCAASSAGRAAAETAVWAVTKPLDEHCILRLRLRMLCSSIALAGVLALLVSPVCAGMEVRPSEPRPLQFGL